MANDRTSAYEYLNKVKFDIVDNIVTVGSLVFWAIVLHWAYAQTIPRTQYGLIFLGGIVVLYLLTKMVEAVEASDWIDFLVLIASTVVMSVSTVYLYTNFRTVYVIRQGFATDHEYILAVLVILTILYLTWREFGNVFLILLGGTIVYALYGYHAPGILSHGGVPPVHVLQQLVTDLKGFYGSITQIVAAWIAPFMLYAGLLLAYGAFDLILRVAIVASKHIKSGVAQTAVIASAIIGSINGSYAANAGMTGSVTIPTMKESGMKAENAAAVEAVASTAGQALPPVMGASAFVMASFLGIRYVDIIVAGLMPAIIFVTAIIIGVHYVSIRDTGAQSMDFDDYFDVYLTREEKIVEGIRYGVPFLILIYTLGILQYTVMTAALYTVIAMIILGIGTPMLRILYEVATGKRSTHAPREDGEPDSFDSITRFRPVRTLVHEVKLTIQGFRRGALILAPIAIIIAAINGVVDLFLVTGVPSAMALMLMELSGGILIVALLLAMLVCIIMGVGMPTVAAYIVVSILVAPTLIQEFGAVEIAAHYMVFYAAILAGITPPVAPAAIITAGIAEANFWKTCSTAIRMAAPLFVLPIAFIYHPEIVSTTFGVPTVVSGVLVMAGAFSMIYGLNYGFELKGIRNLLVRFLITALGIIVMTYPSNYVQAVGAAIFVVIFFGEKLVVRDWKPTFLSSLQS